MLSSKYIVGIDIGGTNTDAVLVNQSLEVVCSNKTNTTPMLEEGARSALVSLLELSGIDKREIGGIYVGTTHAMNAIIERKNLYRIGVLRIAGHYPTSLPPCYAWPEEMKQATFCGYETISGGFDCDSREISPFNPKEACEAINRLLEKGAEGIAIISVFSSIIQEHEELCADLVRKVAGGDFPFSLSHKIGGIGFIERENATVINTALKKAMEEGFKGFQKIKENMGMSCPLFFTQNDGSLIDLCHAINYPLLTVSSGSSNSFIGASKLSGNSDAVVVDVGGTSTDIGIVSQGYPRRSMHNAKIEGVLLNFRIPDVLAFSLGGGSDVVYGDDGSIQIGPKSCGALLKYESQVFGGKRLTLTDVSCLSGHLTIPLAKIGNLSLTRKEAQEIHGEALKKIRRGIETMRGKDIHLPVIVVGGGGEIAAEIATDLPKHFSVANAYGAALAEITATVDTVVSLESREKILEELKDQAFSKAVDKGANWDSTRIVDFFVIPYHYLPNQLARVVVTASGSRF